jgi:hypothetical protein
MDPDAFRTEADGHEFAELLKKEKKKLKGKK